MSKQIIRQLEREMLKSSRKIKSIQAQIGMLPSQHSYYEKEIRYHRGVLKGYETTIKLIEEKE